MRDTLDALFPGCGSDPALQIDEHEAERKEDGKLRVDFYRAPIEDFLPTHGGHLDMTETEPEAVERLKALGCKTRKHPKEADTLIVEPCGRPVYREEVYIRISRPGDRDLINERPATSADRVRFPKHWANFEKGAAAGVVGTPLTEMPFINTAMREEFAYFGVVTGEQLVGMSDANAMKFPYMSRIKPHVQRFLDAKEADAPFKAAEARMEVIVQRENADLKAQLVAMQAQLAAMAAPVNAKPPEPEPSKQRR